MRGDNTECTYFDRETLSFVQISAVASITAFIVILRCSLKPSEACSQSPTFSIMREGVSLVVGVGLEFSFYLTKMKIYGSEGETYKVMKVHILSYTVFEELKKLYTSLLALS